MENYFLGTLLKQATGVHYIMVLDWYVAVGLCRYGGQLSTSDTTLCVEWALEA